MKKSDFYDCGFRRIVCAVPEIKIADTDSNKESILRIIEKNSDADIILFPELCVTGYTCGDLFGQQHLLRSSDKAIMEIASSVGDQLVVIGAPVTYNNGLYNCAIFLHNKKVAGIVPKTYLPNYSEYYEERWFLSSITVNNGSTILHKDFECPFGADFLYSFRGMIVGAEICEDLWVPEPPSGKLAMQGANVILNLSASNETIGKHRYRTELIKQQSARCRAVYAYASAGIGESSTDLAFPGYAAIAEDGTIIAESDRFSYGVISVKGDVDIDRIMHDRLHINTFGNLIGNIFNSPETENELADTEVKLESRSVDAHPFVPSDISHRNENCTEIIFIQCHGLRRRLEAINCHKIVIGVSGGLDSTLALLVACRTFDQMGLPRTGIQAITMPGLATTNRTRSNAWQLMELLGVTCLEIPIGPAVDQHFKDIEQDPENHDAAYENSQARERTQILMDYANKCNGIVLGTGDLSELALGWCTYNGDHMSMYAVNASIPKTLVKHLVQWFADRAENKKVADVLRDIINTPISPELVPSDEDSETIAQKTEDLVGPYELHDFFLFNTLRYGFTPRKVFLLAQDAFAGIYDDKTILKWMQNFYRRFFNQQFKRSCMPDGPKVGSVCLSPRGDWRMPSDASSALWLKEVNKMVQEL